MTCHQAGKRVSLPLSIFFLVKNIMDEILALNNMYFVLLIAIENLVGCRNPSNIASLGPKTAFYSEIFQEK